MLGLHILQFQDINTKVFHLQHMLRWRRKLLYLYLFSTELNKKIAFISGVFSKMLGPIIVYSIIKPLPTIHNITAKLKLSVELASYIVWALRLKALLVLVYFAGNVFLTTSIQFCDTTIYDPLFILVTPSIKVTPFKFNQLHVSQTLKHGVT